MSIRTSTNGKNENRGCPSVFEGRGEGSHKIPVQFRQINPSKNNPRTKSANKPFKKYLQKKFRKKFTAKNVPKMYLKVEFWIR